jgi:nitrite reductase (NADH) small subunit/3-phenylpropionate/trans-cinnamate dioxygenase ferredoxin subunit
MTFEPVAKVDDLSPGEHRAITAGGRQLVLYRLGDEYFATQRECLHQGGDLAEGVVMGRSIVCGVHGWRFDIRTGCHEQSPDTCLRTYAVEVQDGEVRVDPTPRRPAGGVR